MSYNYKTRTQYTRNDGITDSIWLVVNANDHAGAERTSLLTAQHEPKFIRQQGRDAWCSSIERLAVSHYVKEEAQTTTLTETNNTLYTAVLQDWLDTEDHKIVTTTVLFAAPRIASDQEILNWCKANVLLDTLVQVPAGWLNEPDFQAHFADYNDVINKQSLYRISAASFAEAVPAEEPQAAYAVVGRFFDDDNVVEPQLVELVLNKQNRVVVELPASDTLSYVAMEYPNTLQVVSVKDQNGFRYSVSNDAENPNGCDFVVVVSEGDHKGLQKATPDCSANGIELIYYVTLEKI